MRILITDDTHPIFAKTLIGLGCSLDNLPDIRWEEALDIIDQYQGIVVNSKMIMNKQMLDRAVQLKFIARLGSGLDIIDLVETHNRGIQVFSAPDGNANAVAEHALGMLLALANNLISADREIRQFEWNREANRGFEISGRTVGIIGFGNNGSALARKLSGWDVKVLAYDKYKTGFENDYPHITACDLKTIQQHADIISLHIPLTAETHHYVNQLFIDACQKSFVLINTSRGKNIETLAVLKALKTGKMAGLCMDVFENEKPSTYTPSEKAMYQELLSAPKAVFSPHIAGWTIESKERIATILLDKISAFIKRNIQI